MILPLSNIARNGILGINKRNADYILRYNQRAQYPLVDNKLKTKALAKQFGIPVPDLYARIDRQHEIPGVSNILNAHSDFVIKPAHGSGGEGVLVIAGRTKAGFLKSSGKTVSLPDLEFHLSNILGGLFSLGGQNDTALIEYRVKFDPLFEKISFGGVPDIRIIIFLGVPVMAMVRLPTGNSDGKANLHQGAIGAGVEIPTGRTMGAVWGTDLIDEHPDTGHSVNGLEIPNWNDLLIMASKCYDMTGLGYQGVDIVLDRDLGPLMLEINARPGLAIQIANRAGLVPRLALVEKFHEKLTSTVDKVAFAKENF